MNGDFPQNSPPNVTSDALARYIEQSDGITKPWLLVQLRLQKLKERRGDLSETDYLKELAEIHQASMNLGAWWVGIENEVFG